jgi:hypothetical protein
MIHIIAKQVMTCHANTDEAHGSAVMASSVFKARTDFVAWYHGTWNQF